MAHTILIIEDEPPLRKALVHRLGMEDFTVLEAADGEIGLEMALQHKPDLILLDVVMPNMDGLTAIKKLRQDPWG